MDKKVAMRILFLNQTFHPDVVSSGQHLTDLAIRLAERGHQVTVITSRRAYDEPQKTFPKSEIWRGVRIYRVSNTGFGKRAKWRRAVDFATFMWSCWWRLLFLPKQDMVVSLTSPPLISFVGAIVARTRGSQFCYWIMDLNPDEALAAGWLRPKSLSAIWLERFSRFSMKAAFRVVVLDEFMRGRVCEKGIPSERVAVVPPWSHDSEVRFDPIGRTEFRKMHRLTDKFVVMYSGNHSPCHPLDTVLEAAMQLAGHDDIMFCFVGGGSEFQRVKRFAAERGLSNILCLPYQPRSQLSASLSAADLHFVIMGDPFVGIVHPCKVYNLLRIGAPFLYIGPKSSHISQIIEKLDAGCPKGEARHGQALDVVNNILCIKKLVIRHSRQCRASVSDDFSADALLPRLVGILENPSCSMVLDDGLYAEAPEKTLTS